LLLDEGVESWGRKIPKVWKRKGGSSTVRRKKQNGAKGSLRRELVVSKKHRFLIGGRADSDSGKQPCIQIGKGGECGHRKGRKIDALNLLGRGEYIIQKKEKN